ncbi:hypothetical protein K456DRAFT_1741870 [Colletotrichum gloeosporioides 23]|nr:hypothetical protein K456DRAFT_1741870 [Colletotrichum gloeosporioides 23]
MTLITDIPCELIASILRNLDELRSLTPALLSCRHIYSSYKQSPKIAAAILRQKVTPALLPYAVAASEAYSLPRPRDGDTIQGLLNALYEEPLGLAKRVTSLPMTKLMEMSPSIDVLAHDVNFGEFSVDYLTGGEENIYRQMWLSKGIGFIHRLINEKSYDGKRDMLTEHPDIGVANFPGALANVLGAYQGANAFVGREEELLYENVTRVTDEDPDQGPFNSWYAAHEGAPLYAGLMLHEHELLRDWAYVLWDCDRVETYHLLKAFEKLSDARHEKEYDEMNESFHERSQIGKRGDLGIGAKATPAAYRGQRSLQRGNHSSQWSYD